MCWTMTRSIDLLLWYSQHHHTCNQHQPCLKHSRQQWNT